MIEVSRSDFYMEPVYVCGGLPDGGRSYHPSDIKVLRDGDPLRMKSSVVVLSDIKTMLRSWIQNLDKNHDKESKQFHETINERESTKRMSAGIVLVLVIGVIGFHVLLFSYIFKWYSGVDPLAEVESKARNSDAISRRTTDLKEVVSGRETRRERSRLETKP